MRGSLDEFALWLHLEDVYWTEEVRKSIDAVMVAVIVGFALLAGTSPVGVNSKTAAMGLVAVSVFLVIHMIYTVICLLKGKLATGIIGPPLPLVGFVGAVRLAKPSSFWARRFYKPTKIARAEKRFGPEQQLRRERMRSLLGAK